MRNFMDEIAYAHLAKLKDKGERRESEIHEKEQIKWNKIAKKRREKFHRDILLLLVFPCLKLDVVNMFMT